MYELMLEGPIWHVFFFLVFYSQQKKKFICQTSYFVMDDETMAVWHLSRT